MYTINDLKGYIEIAGAVMVIRYNTNNRYEILYQNKNGLSDIPEDVLNSRITFMYSENHYLVIEVE